jgi:hypothetical protein
MNFCCIAAIAGMIKQRNVPAPITAVRAANRMTHMAKQSHLRPADLHGASRLTIDAVIGVTHLIESLHASIASRRGILGRVTTTPTRGITGQVYRVVRWVTGLVGRSLDVLLGRLVLLIGESGSSPGREAVLAALNGVLGDYLAETANPLAIRMCFRVSGQALVLEKGALSQSVAEPGNKLLVVLHGLCMNDLQWGPLTSKGGKVDEKASAASMPERLAELMGFGAVYLHYNSGRHISENGRDFAALMTQLVAQWPVPVDEIVILTHSMGACSPEARVTTPVCISRPGWRA